MPNDLQEPQEKQDNSEAYPIESSDDDIPLSNLKKEAFSPNLESSDDDIPLSNLRKEAPSKVLGSPEVDTESTIISLERLNKILTERFRTVRTIHDLGRVQTFNIRIFR